MLINCAKGCGVPIEISMEQIEEAQRLNVPLNVAHSICPGEEGAPPRIYSFTVTVTRKNDGDDASEVALSEVSGSVSGKSFTDCFESLTKLLSKRWEQVQKFAPVADTDDIQPTIEGNAKNAQGQE